LVTRLIDLKSKHNLLIVEPPGKFLNLFGSARLAHGRAAAASENRKLLVRFNGSLYLMQRFLGRNNHCFSASIHFSPSP
jgi:hypothetical protein